MSQIRPQQKNADPALGVSKRLQLESVVSVVVPEIADHNSPCGSSHLHTHNKKMVRTTRHKIFFREMGGSIGSAHACYYSSLGSNPDIYQKYKMGDISKEVANTP